MPLANEKPSSRVKSRFPFGGSFVKLLNHLDMQLLYSYFFFLNPSEFAIHGSYGSP